MRNDLHNQIKQIQPKIHGLAVGMTLGLSTLYFGQGCAATGLCPACGACALKLPIFLLPLLADGGLVLAQKALSRSALKPSDLNNDSKG